MPRTARIAPGGLIYHVFNRGVGRSTLFRSKADYAAFVRCLIDTHKTLPAMRILGFCIMPNHWHLVLRPARNGDLGRFMMRLTITHARRWLIHRQQVGTGHVYQGRYKSFAVQDDAHLATLCRYVERNALRAGLCKGSAEWPWSSAGRETLSPELRVELAEWPIARRRDWRSWVDLPQTAAEEQAIARSIKENRPYGTAAWTEKIKSNTGWREPLRPGRPRKRKS